MNIIKYCIAALATVSCMVATAQGGIVEREYWLDNNIVQSQSLGASPTTLDISSLPAGLHWFTMRVKDGEGMWSPTLTKAFIIPNELDNSTATTIQGGEYWLDNNIANRQSIGAAPVTLDISSLSAGLHWFTMRVTDDLGFWSPALTRAFIIPNQKDLSTATSIERREVWFDNNVAERQTIGVAPVMLDISSLPAGLHSLTMRVQDDLGYWSSSVSKYFIIPEATVEEDSVELVRYCYWIDDDVANLVVCDLPVCGKVVAGVIDLDIATLTSGQHTISWIVGDKKDVWGFFTGEVNTMEFFNNRGDVNDDRCVDISDVSDLIDFLLGTTTDINTSAANVNYDDGIDISDLSELIDYLLYGTW